MRGHIQALIDELIDDFIDASVADLVASFAAILPAGTLLDLRIGAANLDADQFERLHEVDLDRPNARNHLSFGSGIHFCIGAALVRQDLAMALASLIGRLGDIALKPGVGRPTHLHSFAVRGLTALPVTFARRV